jgi:hypothetical protein
MSFDLAVWYPDKRLSAEEANGRYARLCEGNVEDLAEDAAVHAFYTELVAKHPEIDDIPEDRIDDHEYCPWSVAMDRSPGHVILCCVWSRAGYVRRYVGQLAAKHGLVLYDPQEGTAIYPGGSDPSGGTRGKSWWKFGDS